MMQFDGVLLLTLKVSWVWMNIEQEGNEGIVTTIIRDQGDLPFRICILEIIPIGLNV